MFYLCRCKAQGLAPGRQAYRQNHSDARACFGKGVMRRYPLNQAFVRSPKEPPIARCQSTAQPPRPALASSETGSYGH